MWVQVWPNHTFLYLDLAVSNSSDFIDIEYDFLISNSVVNLVWMSVKLCWSQFAGVCVGWGVCLVCW